MNEIIEERITELDFMEAPIICDSLSKIHLFMGKLWNVKNEKDIAYHYKDCRTGDYVFGIKQ